MEGAGARLRTFSLNIIGSYIVYFQMKRVPLLSERLFVLID